MRPNFVAAAALAGTLLGQNGAVSKLAHSRLLTGLALLAWLAQLCLPVAHAAVMAGQNAGLATWCGPMSAGLSEKLAQLPYEVREILEKGSAQAGQHSECLSFCATAGGAGLPSISPTAELRAAGLEPPVESVVSASRSSQSCSPPVRGPPLNT